MNTFLIKGLLSMILAIGPMCAISLGAWSFLIALISWCLCYRVVSSMVADIKREERRAAGQAARRSRECVKRRTRPYYNK
jgi:ABC-type dipeptide/oligopeptide/nickel transport system permease subunit